MCVYVCVHVCMYVGMSQGRREITKNNRKGQGKMRINYSTLCSIGNERMAGWLAGWVGVWGWGIEYVV